MCFRENIIQRYFEFRINMIQKKKKKNQITAEIKQITILTLLDKIFDKFIIYNSHNWKEGKTEKKKEIFISRIFSFYADTTVMWTCQ